MKVTIKQDKNIAIEASQEEVELLFCGLNKLSASVLYNVMNNQLIDTLRKEFIASGTVERLKIYP